MGRRPKRGGEHQYLHHHLHHEDGCEDVVGDAEEGPLLQGETSGRSTSTSPCPTQRASLPSETHSAAWVNVWPLQGNGDTVEEDEDKDHVVKHLVCDDFLAGDA